MLYISITSSLQWSARDGYGQYNSIQAHIRQRIHALTARGHVFVWMVSVCLFARSFVRLFTHSFFSEFLFVSAAFIFFTFSSSSSSSFYFRPTNTICCLFAWCYVRCVDRLRLRERFYSLSALFSSRSLRMQMWMNECIQCGWYLKWYMIHASCAEARKQKNPFWNLKNRKAKDVESHATRWKRYEGKEKYLASELHYCGLAFW